MKAMLIVSLLCLLVAGLCTQLTGASQPKANSTLPWPIGSTCTANFRCDSIGRTTNDSNRVQVLHSSTSDDSITGKLVQADGQWLVIEENDAVIKDNRQVWIPRSSLLMMTVHSQN